MTTEFYFSLSKMCELDSGDFENMTVGMVIDHIDCYLEMKNPSKKNEKVVEYADEIPWL